MEYANFYNAEKELKYRKKLSDALRAVQNQGKCELVSTLKGDTSNEQLS